MRVDPTRELFKGDWNRPADKADFLPVFEDWCFDWIDCPAMIRASGTVYEYPMVDRAPLPSWTEGCATLIGDAAHATYPVGSNGAPLAIIDARKLGAAFRAHSVFDDIETVIARAELAAHAEKYKRLSGFSVDIPNAQAPIIGPVVAKA